MSPEIGIKMGNFSKRRFVGLFAVLSWYHAHVLVLLAARYAIHAHFALSC